MEMIAKSFDVALFENKSANYPNVPPFNPSKCYPEYPLQTDKFLCTENNVYESVRETLRLLKFDADHFGTKSWNPFRDLISPGNKVVIKPNLVSDWHWSNGDLFSIITHPSVIRAVVDYCYIALKGDGEIIIADSPILECDFNALLRKTDLQSISNFYKGELSFDVKILDLRPYCWGNRLSSNRLELEGDPLGYVSVNLHEDSNLAHLDSKKFWCVDDHREETPKYHNDMTHKYLISKTVLSADCVILIPKLKVHRKVGVTLNVKCLVGIVGNKQCLPHFRMGTPVEGGDSSPDICNAKIRAVLKFKTIISDFLSKNNVTYDLKNRFINYLYKNNLGLRFSINSLLKDKSLFSPLSVGTYGNVDKRIGQFQGGSWHGNDTTWRMAADLYQIFFFADTNGKMKMESTRNVFSIIDGIVGGEGDGPLAPTARHCGVILGGLNPVAVDLVATRLMGLDFSRLKMYQEILNSNKWTILSKNEVCQIDVKSNNPKYVDILRNNGNKHLQFEPPVGWKNITYTGCYKEHENESGLERITNAQ